MIILLISYFVSPMCSLFINNHQVQLILVIVTIMSGSPMKKSKTSSSVTLPMTCIGGIMEFCNARDRRSISSTCKELGEIYTGDMAERCSLMALGRIVKQKKSDWKLPVLDHSTTTWNKCLLEILSKDIRQTTQYSLLILLL